MSKPQKIKLVVAYDGIEFAGWQRQKHSAKPTAQGTLESSLSRLLDRPVRVIGASRTDAGVHALAQVAHFEVPSGKDLSNYQLVRGLNGILPEAMVVRGAYLAPENFHALASAEGKTYRYLIHNSSIRNPLRRHRTAWVDRPLDLNVLNRLTLPLLGELDFKSFQTSGTEVLHTVRRIDGAVWRPAGPALVEFSITGNGFLKQMVRNIVGTLLDLHFSGKPPEMMKEILDAKDRRRAGRSAPPQGLYLTKVHYPGDLDNQCRKL